MDSHTRKLKPCRLGLAVQMTWKPLVESLKYWKVVVDAIINRIDKLAVREAVKGGQSPADTVNIALSNGFGRFLRSHRGVSILSWELLPASKNLGAGNWLVC